MILMISLSDYRLKVLSLSLPSIKCELNLLFYFDLFSYTIGLYLNVTILFQLKQNLWERRPRVDTAIEIITVYAGLIAGQESSPATNITIAGIGAAVNSLEYGIFLFSIEFRL